ncbi:hypothetical protein LDENG_00045930 [Lucifuga dentata]|nr:hypothetical protein LDENG_00045930 [Lucifuga dentata]
MMDPHFNQRQTNEDQNSAGPSDGSSDMTGNDNLPENPNRSEPDRGNQHVTNRQPQYSSGFTLIPPNESRRSRLQMMAQKEEQDFQRWKEAHRPAPVHLTPERLGGDVTLAKAREKQLAELRHSKLQKKLKKEDLDKRRRQEEEEELQKMKAIQREKAERLEERRRLEEQQRREQLRADHLRATESFLQSVERTASDLLATSSATHTSSWSDAEENKQSEKKEKSLKDVKQEHIRVNSAFLDKIERQSGGSEKVTKTEEVWEDERPYLACEDFGHQLSQTSGPHYLKPDPERSSSGGAEEADPQLDHDWALMKLVNRFPQCTMAFLEDILNQSSGDYQQAYTLLSSTLS